MIVVAFDNSDIGRNIIVHDFAENLNNRKRVRVAIIEFIAFKFEKGKLNLVILYMRKIQERQVKFGNMVYARKLFKQVMG